VVARGDNDTSLFADVALKPGTEYRLSAWIRTHAMRGKASLNDHIGRAETEKVTARESDWTEVEVIFNSGSRTKASINLLQVAASGDAFFDDVKLCELTMAGEATVTAGVPARGAEIFWKHPTAACATCHIYVDEAFAAETGRPSAMEESMLDFADNVQPNSRLSCQIRVTDDLDGLIVRLPESQH
jgi:hypothetical protein